MKTVLAYVLVSSEKDFYLEQCFVSTASARHHQPDARIVIICDDKTAAALEDPSRGRLTRYADEVISVPLPADMSPMRRSRMLKTSLRSHISGDYLYIDTDTIITAPLAGMDSIQDDICGVTDCHSATAGENLFIDMMDKQTGRVGTRIQHDKPYFNSGVLFVRDTPAAHEFYRIWHSEYQKGTEKGINMDQPTFEKAKNVSGTDVRVLDGEWNCQLRYGLRYITKARILHYLWTTKAESPYITGDLGLWQKTRETGEVPAEFKALFEDPMSGFREHTYVSSASEMQFMRTRSFRAGYKWFRFSKPYYRLMNGCISILDIIYKNTHRG